MNKGNLKSYAPQARLDFIAAVTARANLLGITATGVSSVEARGDVAIIEGREWSGKIVAQRDKLVARILRHGFDQSMEEVAYTWFNRFAALRYMELHDYLAHGWRVLSSRDGGLPEILMHASEVLLPGLSQERVKELQLAGNQDNELYKLLLVAQCNELSRSMPFLFERIDDETELLLPENLLRTDSVLVKLVMAVPEEDWGQVEAIGWLYQFYISDKKNEVIGKVSRSEDIPAATQLFTPNWIVKFLLQNSVGKMWAEANPSSMLSRGWEFALDAAEQPVGPAAALKSLIDERISEDGAALSPELIQILDPACGSGHILVEAYDLLKSFYLERGHRARDIPRMILERNLFGIDIDDRAAQMSSFALIMKARADDRRIFDAPVRLNVVSLTEPANANVADMMERLSPFGVELAPARQLVIAFAAAKTLGSLIRLPDGLADVLPAMEISLSKALESGDLYARAAAQDLLPLVAQARILSRHYDAVVANPPYMGSRGMPAGLKTLSAKLFPISSTDLFSMFMERSFLWCKPSGRMAMVTMQSWMFLSSYQSFRAELLNKREIFALTQIGYNSFPEMNSKVAQACAFVMGPTPIEGFVGKYVNLNDAPQSADKAAVFLERSERRMRSRTREQFKMVPGDAIAITASETALSLFESKPSLAEFVDTREGLTTGSNETFLRYWHEVELAKIRLPSPANDDVDQKKWVPYLKGGPYRRWGGNQEYVVNWEADGRDMRAFSDPATGRIRSHNYNGEFAFRAGITWSSITSGDFSVRCIPDGFMFDAKAPMGFSDGGLEPAALAAFLNSKVAGHFIKMLAPTLDFKIGHVLNLPFDKNAAVGQVEGASRCVELSNLDWAQYETFWKFERPAFVPPAGVGSTIAESWTEWEGASIDRFQNLKQIEERNNQAFIDAYGLGDEIDPSVSDSLITMRRADAADDAQRFVSYAMGCQMGRYSLDELGLVYAGSGGVGFDAERYQAFSADSDGIVPVTDLEWFDDDAAGRLRELVRTVWARDRLEENLSWLAARLGAKANESPEATIRRYFAERFFKHHVQMYSRRPIYWLFSSGRAGAFQALVYMHRYNEGTLARMRSEYVVPLMAKFATRLDLLAEDSAKATSAAHRAKLSKGIEILRKKQTELLAYEEKLRHHAEMRIRIDLDDGVKANYAKFGDLVADSKIVCGASDE